MATKALEARFEHLSVKDENDSSRNANYYPKQKVLTRWTQCALQDRLVNLLPGLSFNGRIPIRSWAQRTAEQ